MSAQHKDLSSDELRAIVEKARAAGDTVTVDQFTPLITPKKVQEGSWIGCYPNPDALLVRGEIEKFIQLLDADQINPNYKPSHDRPLLHQAIESGKDHDMGQVIAKLLEKGADPNTVYISGTDTALRKAAHIYTVYNTPKIPYKTDYLAVIKDLLNAGADPNRAGNGWLLGSAASSGDIPLVTMLLKAGADANDAYYSKGGVAEDVKKSQHLDEQTKKQIYDLLISYGAHIPGMREPTREEKDAMTPRQRESYTIAKYTPKDSPAVGRG